MEINWKIFPVSKIAQKFFQILYSILHDGCEILKHGQNAVAFEKKVITTETDV